MYADDVTHLFVDAATCNEKGRFIYTSLDEESKRCVLDCMKTDKQFTHNGECLLICPQYYYSEEPLKKCTKECPAGYYEYGEDRTCRITCQDQSCKTCDYATD